MYLLSSVAEAAHDQLVPHYSAVFDLVTASLQDSNMQVCEYAIKSMTVLVPNLAKVHGPAFQGTVSGYSYNSTCLQHMFAAHAHPHRQAPQPRQIARRGTCLHVMCARLPISGKM